MTEPRVSRKTVRLVEKRASRVLGLRREARLRESRPGAVQCKRFCVRGLAAHSGISTVRRDRLKFDAIADDRKESLRRQPNGTHRQITF